MTEAEPIVIEPLSGPRKAAKIAFKAVCWPRFAFPQVETRLAALGTFGVHVEYPSDWEWQRVVTNARDILAERLVAQGTLARPVLRPFDHKVVRIEWLEPLIGGAR